MHRVTFQPVNVSVEIDSQTTLREAAHLAGVSVHDRCGGMGACCNCVVTIQQGEENLSARTVVEEAVFYLSETERLSCQCTVVGDVELKVL
jgi:ferredoxin